MTIRWSAFATALLTGLISVGTTGCGDDDTTPTGSSASTGSPGGTGGEGPGGTGGAGPGGTGGAGPGGTGGAGPGGTGGAGQGGTGGAGQGGNGGAGQGGNGGAGQGGNGGAGQGGNGGSAAVCGDGTLEGAEACDDSNMAANDGCSASCAVEAGYTCAGSPSACSPSCGDNMAVGAEPCDGPDLAGKDCSTEGFPSGGTLTCKPDCTLDTSGCAQSEACNTGTDEDNDGLVDCNDPDCAADPICSSGNETQCSNIADDDFDNLFDCEDPTDCKTLAICQPGMGLPGSPCLAPSDCAANNTDPICIPEQGYGFLDGYCSEFCDVATNDCPAGSSCVSAGFPSGNGLCADDCATNADCRPGYTCQDFGTGATFCWKALEDCTNGVDDDSDTNVDCTDVDCAGDPSCFEICDNGLDDNGNGLIDCMDPGCAGDPACQVPEVCGNGLDDNGNGLIDCEDPGCAAEPTCPFAMICAGAIPLMNGVPYSGDTTTGTTTFGSGCTGGNGALEKVFSFIPGMAGEAGTLTVVLSSATDQGIYIRTTCEDPSSELICQDAFFGGADETIQISINDAGAPVFIFVDGYFDPAYAGPFTVTASFGAAFCGNGVVEGFEACDPPDGVTCDANCQVIFSQTETTCTDLYDEDSDGLTDCEDPTDCKAMPICAPGFSPVGNICDAPSDCQANDTDPFCIDEAQFGWPQGYCSEFCDLGTNDCPAGSVCGPVINVPSGAGLCMDSCASNADCRPGYSCVDIGGPMICFYQ